MCARRIRNVAEHLACGSVHYHHMRAPRYEESSSIGVEGEIVPASFSAYREAIGNLVFRSVSG